MRAALLSPPDLSDYNQIVCAAAPHWQAFFANFIFVTSPQDLVKTLHLYTELPLVWQQRTNQHDYNKNAQTVLFFSCDVSTILCGTVCPRGLVPQFGGVRSNTRATCDT